jgi:hypothetical protein
LERRTRRLSSGVTQCLAPVGKVRGRMHKNSPGKLRWRGGRPRGLRGCPAALLDDRALEGGSGGTPRRGRHPPGLGVAVRGGAGSASARSPLTWRGRCGKGGAGGGGCGGAASTKRGPPRGGAGRAGRGCGSRMSQDPAKAWAWGAERGLFVCARRRRRARVRLPQAGPRARRPRPCPRPRLRQQQPESRYRGLGHKGGGATDSLCATPGAFCAPSALGSSGARQGGV